MSQDVRPWLPRSAFTLDAVRTALAPALSLWSRQWFSGPAVEILSVGPVEGRTISTGEHLEIAGHATKIRISGRAKRLLLEASLAVRLESVELTEVDHRLLHAFAEAIGKDLAARIDALAADEDKTAGDVTMSILVGLNGEKLADLSCAASMLVGPIKSGIARTPDTAKPASWLSALRLTPVAVEGYLGRVEIGVDDLEGLGVGDVLVLDRPVGDAVDLHLSPWKHLIARGALDQNDGRVSIHL